MKQVVLGRAVCGDFEQAFRREWIVTNGLGGYSAGTISGLNTRRYYGLLVAALSSYPERILMVSKLDTEAYYDGDGKFYRLACNEYANGAVNPHGYHYLESFSLDGATPVWVYAMADARLERRVWMQHGHNTTYITYTLTRATDTMFLKLTPFCTYRSYHNHSQGDWQPTVRTVVGGFEVLAFSQAQPYRVVIDRGEFQRDEDWYWHFRHRLDASRGLDDLEDLFVPGYFQYTLSPGETLTLICSTESVAPHVGNRPYQAEHNRQQKLQAHLPPDSPFWIRQLALAADQFLIRLPTELAKQRATIIAGYPWFTDWARDTLVALNGLTLLTGQAHLAAEILRSFAPHVDQGMLPNRFAVPRSSMEYNTVDTPLWYIRAVAQYFDATQDSGLVEDLYPVLASIIHWYRQGTRHGIYMDPTDGLVWAGQPGQPLTWMDIKVGDLVITPRLGKPVEVNALWYNALCVMSRLSQQLGLTPASQTYRQEANRAAESFRRRFWFTAGEYLYDNVDSPTERDDPTLRPNQILAVSLTPGLLSEAQAKAVVDVCGLHLLTSHGLRTLAPDEAGYRGGYTGSLAQRDMAYHQGTIWTWLLGHYVVAHYNVYHDAQMARSFLDAISLQLYEAGMGSLSEIFDGDPPHRPHGCFAQAWSVSEILWAWHVTR